MSLADAQIHAVLKARSFLSGLADAEIERLVQRGRVTAYAKGQSIYQRGDDGDSLMVILSGRVKISNISADAKEIVLNFLTEGDVNGELAALDGRERSANAVAMEPTRVLILYRRDLISILKANPEGMLRIIEILCGKVRAMSSMIEHNSLQMSGRMASALVRLATQHGRKAAGGGTLIDLKLSQRDLGNYAGLSRENANRQLGELREAGLVRLDGALIVVTDLEGLQDFAEAGSE